MPEDEVTKITSFPLADLLSDARDSGRPYLIVLAGSRVGEMFKLDDQETTIGRSVEATINLLDDGISRLHCKLVTLPTGDILIKDLDSTNGTFANGQKIAQHLLSDGDKIQVGSTTILKFSYHDDLEEHFQRQMYESALRDGLTQAFNKRYFLDRLDAEFAFASRHKKPLSLCMLDLDFFKRLNDTHGHLAGDYVLQGISERVSTTVRAEDVFSRYGGEEFAVISRGIGIPDALAMAERIRSGVESHRFAYGGEALRVTVSIGVAGLPEPTITSPERLIQAADDALYEAKRAGRNRVCLYHP